MDNFKIIYKILAELESQMDLSVPDTEKLSAENLNVSEQRWLNYIEMLNDAGYIKGVDIQLFRGGHIRADITKVKITLKGLEYLAENSIMQKMYKAVKGTIDLIT